MSSQSLPMHNPGILRVAASIARVSPYYRLSITLLSPEYRHGILEKAGFLGKLKEKITGIHKPGIANPRSREPLN